MQAGTKSINNRDPSRQDWQPQGAMDQLRQERRKQRQIRKARLQSQPRGPTAEPAEPQTHEPKHMYAITHTYTQQPKPMGH